MPKYLVLSKLSPAGCRMIKEKHEPLAELARRVEEAGGKITEQYALLGEHDFCTVIELRDNDAAHFVELTEQSGEMAVHWLFAAIDLELFVRLMRQTTENTGPYRWQISWPARIIRLFFRRYAYTGVAKRNFKPFTIYGKEHFDGLKGPALFIANHTSFMDGPAMYSVLPWRYQNKIAWPAAADRFFIKGRRDPRKQGWWFSLVANSFPLKRGGGRAALAHADWLIEKGWSIGIFPEGARTSAHKLARFRLGPAILAVTHGLPVVPMYLEGLAAVRPKGSRQITPGPVTVWVGPPLRFARGTDPVQANHELYRAVNALGAKAADARRAARARAAPAADVP
jgi:1-acyl-sn-glycerol-3-phosphate acyltransferase